MTFEIKDNHFYHNGEKTFLNSGEIHYFRIRRELWDTHLLAAKEAGLTTVSSYVPWAWHEDEESVFDFSGQSYPQRDLLGWIDRCEAHGLKCILKPGPFILAEYRGAGLPDWFVEKYGSEVKMRNRQGQIVPSDGVNLFHQIFIDKVSLWYDQIMPIIAKRQISNGGPVIMMQICNEIGVFSWLAHQADYGNKVPHHFIEYLSKKFKTIDKINKLWGTDYSDFGSIDMPMDGRVPFESNFDKARDYEWHLFWREYYGNYLRMLTKMARERGVTVPFYHNLPGWIYGSGYEFPVNITMYEDLFEDKSEIIFGVDHIPEFLSYRNMHDDRIINDITRAMQGNKPLFAAEFQCGSREYHVVTNPRELELFYKASVANGLTGWNYYMFSQGRNPQHKGYSGETFYWFNPLTPEGEKTTAFPLVQRMNKLIKTAEKPILESERKAEVAVLFYPPYYSSELERPLGPTNDTLFNPFAIRRTAYFDGLLKVLQVLNIDYDMLDLNKATAKEMLAYKQVWAFTTDEMNAVPQQEMVDYAKNGGQLVVFPYLPDRDMLQQPCTILRDALKISPAGKEIIDSPLIDVFGLKDIKCANPLITYHLDDDNEAEPIAWTLNGSVCGFMKNLGEGSLVHLGTWLGFDTEGHKPVYEALLKLSRAHLRHATSNNFQVNVKQRFSNQNTGILFAGNYYNEEQLARVNYTHPSGKGILSIPYLRNEMLWPALYAVLSPTGLQLAPGIQLLHCTSDLLNVVSDSEKIELTLFGDRDLLGEILLEGENISRIQWADTQGDGIKLTHIDNRIVLNYNHFHKHEFIITIKIK